MIKNVAHMRFDLMSIFLANAAMFILNVLRQYPNFYCPLFELQFPYI